MGGDSSTNRRPVRRRDRQGENGSGRRQSLLEAAGAALVSALGSTFFSDEPEDESDEVELVDDDVFFDDPRASFL